MSIRIPPRALTPVEVSEILKIDKKDITASKLKYLFAVVGNATQAKFQPNDTLTIPANKLYNKAPIQTTIGRYIFNTLCTPVPYLKKHGYINFSLTESAIGDIEKQMATMILNDEMTTKEYAEFMDNAEWLGMNTSYYISPSLTKNLVVPIPEVMKRKEELFDQYKSELDKGNLDVSNKIETELLSMAKEKLEKLDDPSYDMYKTGIFKFPVNYKKCSIMVGPVANPQDGKITVLKSDYTDGLSKDEYGPASALTVIGGYSRGVSTQKYGYESKKYNASLQNASVDIDGSNVDCGTQKYLSIVIPKELKSMFLYRYIIDGSQLVETTPDNIDKYVGKEVKLRSPMFCKSDTICEHCAGTLFKRMGLKEVGLVSSNLTGNLLNKSMKKMHDATIKVNKIDIEKYISER